MAPKRKRQRLDDSLGTLDVEGKSVATPSAAETALEDELFGSLKATRTLRATEIDEDDGEEWQGITDDQLFFVDTTNTPRSDDEPVLNAETRRPRKAKKAALWVDPADQDLSVSLRDVPRLRKLRHKAEEDVVDGTEYTARLRKQFEKSFPAPAWAAVARKEAQKRKEDVSTEDDDGLSSLLKTAGAGLRRRTGTTLRAGEISINRVKDANTSSDSKSDITALGFHPKAQVLFATSKDKRLRLFNINGSNHPLLQTIHLPEMPMELASFNPDGSSVFLAGPRPYFFTYDLQAGRMIRSPRGLWNSGLGGTDDDKPTGGITHFRHSPDGRLIACAARRGYVHLLDVRAAGSGMVVGQLRHSSSGIAGLSWSPDATTFISAGKDAEMYVWDIRSLSCSSRWRDEGGFGVVGLEGDQSGTFLATGSTTGVVNVYDAHHAFSSTTTEHKPLKAIQNLTTEVSAMRFNADSQLLALASAKKKDQFKLVHLPSLSVYQNWPTRSTPLGRVTAVDFSRGSELLAIGSKGRVLLYSLQHYAHSR